MRVTSAEKRAIVAKARRLGLSASELMRRAALAYESDREQLATLADLATAAAGRAGAAIDDALAYVAASNARIARMESDRARA